MLSDSRIVAFTATTQPEPAKTFYRDLLGLKLVEESPYALVFAAGSTMLRVQIVGEFVPQPFTMIGWDVRYIRATVAELIARGIVMLHVPFIEQDADEIWWTPNGDGVAWFKDPDGNTLSVTQFARPG